MKPHNTCYGHVNVTTRRESARRVIEYLFDASDASLGHFELAHLNLAANFRKDFVNFLDMLVQELAEARAARMIREIRALEGAQAGVVFLALMALLWQHQQRISTGTEPVTKPVNTVRAREGESQTRKGSLQGPGGNLTRPAETGAISSRTPRVRIPTVPTQDSGGARSTEQDTTGTLSPLLPRRLTARNARGAARKKSKA